MPTKKKKIEVKKGKTIHYNKKRKPIKNWKESYPGAAKSRADELTKSKSLGETFVQDTQKEWREKYDEWMARPGSKNIPYEQWLRMYLANDLADKISQPEDIPQTIRINRFEFDIPEPVIDMYKRFYENAAAQNPTIAPLHISDFIRVHMPELFLKFINQIIDQLTVQNTVPPTEGLRSYDSFVVIEQWGLDNDFYTANAINLIANAGVKNPETLMADLVEARNSIDYKIQQIVKQLDKEEEKIL